MLQDFGAALSVILNGCPPPACKGTINQLINSTAGANGVVLESLSKGAHTCAVQLIYIGT